MHICKRNHETTKVNPSKTIVLTHYSGQLFVPTLKAVQHSMNPYPICDSPLWPLQKSRRNHRSYVWTEALSGMVFVPAHVWTQPKTFIIKQTRIAERRFLTGLQRGYFFWGEGAAIHTQATIKPCRQPLHATESHVRLKHKLIQKIVPFWKTFVTKNKEYHF